jgi:hypothetical protein
MERFDDRWVLLLKKVTLFQQFMLRRLVNIKFTINAFCKQLLRNYPECAALPLQKLDKLLCLGLRLYFRMLIGLVVQFLVQRGFQITDCLVYLL